MAGQPEMGDGFTLWNGLFPQCEGAREKKGCGHERENPRSGLLSADTFGEPHSLKRLDPFAAIVKCHRGQEISNDSGPAGHWYYVIVGAVRRCSIRSDGRRQIVDLMLPRDFFFVSDSRREETVEAIAEETVLASYPRTGRTVRGARPSVRA